MPSAYETIARMRFADWLRQTAPEVGDADTRREYLTVLMAVTGSYVRGADEVAAADMAAALRGLPLARAMSEDKGNAGLIYQEYLDSQLWAARDARFRWSREQILYNNR